MCLSKIQLQESFTNCCKQIVTNKNSQLSQHFVPATISLKIATKNSQLSQQFVPATICSFKVDNKNIEWGKVRAWSPGYVILIFVNIVQHSHL